MARLLTFLLVICCMLCVGCSKPDENVGYGGEVKKNEQAAKQMEGKPMKPLEAPKPSID